MKTLAVFIVVLLYSVTLSSQERITLLFVGDLMQHQAQIDAAHVSEGKYDYSSCFSLIKEQISQADLAIGNLEVTLGGRPYRGYPMFSAPDEYLQAIKDAGFDILLTANNHCLDRGKKGMERTIQLLDSSGIRYAGTYKNLSERRQRYPLFINRNGFRIALLNYTYGTNGIKATSPNIVNYIDKNTILQDIQSAKARQPDAIIACMHWGEEYQSLPNREQRELANWLLQQGVTHIIGSHPHVIQPMELRTNGTERTIQLLDSSGIRYAGTYKNLSERRQRYPLFINRNGFRIALLNYTYGTNGIKATSPNIVNYIDKNTILQDIQSAKARQPDAIIACMHWGEEYQSLPNREQRELANWLLQQGVTHIIGSHPHVIQPMELRTNGTEQHIIVYSLGNFISNMSKANTDGGLIFTLQLEKHPLPQPIRPSYTGQSQTPLPDSNPLPFPYCRVSYCGYNLVWTGRPELTKEKNYILYPASFPTEHLTPEARKHLEIFVKSSRKLLQQHNIGIYEKKK